jgi:hypothetical protein
VNVAILTAAISSGVTLVVAVAGFVAAFLNSKRLNERNDKLVRVNRQLSDLYGPMLMLVSASDVSWRTFMTEYGEGNLSAATPEGAPLVDKEEWMIWVKAALAPLNRQLADKLVKGGDLLIEQEVPPVLIRFIAHVSSWEAVIARWDQDDTSQLFAVVNHPGRELLNYAETGYSQLKETQAALLAAHKRRRLS